MSKKHDFIRSEQNRDKHPESGMAGSAAALEEKQRRTSVQRAAAQDRQAPHSGKYSNDHNKMGDTKPTQTNQGRRTPQSRHDRQVTAGATNVVEARTGGKGGGRGSRGGNMGGRST
jgi:hypothetical protein